MDAHVFRRVTDVLAPLLSGARLEKIQSPAAQVYVFSWYGMGRKLHLVLRSGRQSPFLYLAAERPIAGAPPSASIMRLRKYCGGRRVAACAVDWPARRMSLLFQAPPDATGGPRPPETWLVLDLREGPQLLLGQSPATEADIRWPAAPNIAEACADWRQWPVLTPALRRTLPLLEPLEQAALLADLAVGGGDLFVYTPTDATDNADGGGNGSGGLGEISAWPLPDALCAGRGEQVREDPLEAAALLGDRRVLGGAADRGRAEAAAPYRREAARLARLLEKIDGEEARLREMYAARTAAVALQEVLWRYAPDARLPAVDTDDPACPQVSLDMRLSVRENMQALFHRAARGQRGLPHVRERRRVLTAQLRQAQATAEAVAQGAPLASVGVVAPVRRGGPQAAGARENRWPKGVQAFRSTDGHIILRGRDARGNWALLRVATGHDLWLHVEGGPGSHAVIRRAFAGEEIIEATLHEAAALAAAKSWQKDSPSALILCAQVRHVKPMRGAAPGTVRIDKVERTFRVETDSTIEERLRME